MRVHTKIDAFHNGVEAVTPHALAYARVIFTHFASLGDHYQIAANGCISAPFQTEVCECLVGSVIRKKSEVL